MECNLQNERCGFRCTGYEGQKIWEKIHSLPNEIDCEECSHHADILFTGLHDHVNVGLGKKPYNQKNYKNFVDEVNCAYNTCVAEGRC